jgi:hypothetical protein
VEAADEYDPSGLTAVYLSQIIEKWGDIVKGKFFLFLTVFICW